MQLNRRYECQTDWPPAVALRRPTVRFVLALVLAAALAPASSGQELTLVRKLFEQKLIEELSRHDSEDTAWYNEKSVDRQKWTSGKLLGRKIRLASWTEQAKTWLWFEDPQATLSVELTRLAVNGGRLEFALRAVARRARFKAWGRIPKLAKAAVGGTVHADFEIVGSTAIAGGGLDGSQITTFHGGLRDLQFNKRAGEMFEDLVKDALNDYIADKNDKIRRSIEKAIDRVQFSKQVLLPLGPAMAGG